MCSAGASFLRLPFASRSTASLRRTAASIVSLAAWPRTAGRDPQRSPKITKSLMKDLYRFVNTTLLPNFNCSRFFDDLKRGLDFYLRSQRSGNAAVLRFGELDRVSDGFRRNRFAGEDVMHG